MLYIIIYDKLTRTIKNMSIWILKKKLNYKKKIEKKVNKKLESNKIKKK